MAAVALISTGEAPLLASEELPLHGDAHAPLPIPPLIWVSPFVLLLLAIALLPLIPKAAHWWEHNSNKLLVAAILALATIGHYYFRGFGFIYHGHPVDPGEATVLGVLRHAVMDDFVPFIVLLFSLYTISGGLRLEGDIQATPLTNTTILAIGALIASLIGTTGASMVLIRPLLAINAERRHVQHTVVFFIFLVSNIGGCLLPLGDPPLFLGYLRGVPFAWTLTLWPAWLFCCLLLLGLYYIWDTIAYRREEKADIEADIETYRPLNLRGTINFLWLTGVVTAVAVLVPGRELPGTRLIVPDYLREGVLLGLAWLSWASTADDIRAANGFNFIAIGEVACLFIGIFICMQVPVEILKARGPELGLTQPWHFFWATGALSSFLDNAPTYVVFFETAGSIHPGNVDVVEGVETASGSIAAAMLIAVSLGAVFMGANTYIGNGPNFMVKSIAEQAGVRMPSFFGYMIYSGAILLPTFVLVTLLFL
jgi:Na+/H+ antiporter NhaD/arsenite permease-like protein